MKIAKFSEIFASRISNFRLFRLFIVILKVHDERKRMAFVPLKSVGCSRDLRGGGLKKYIFSEGEQLPLIIIYLHFHLPLSVSKVARYHRSGYCKLIHRYVTLHALHAVRTQQRGVVWGRDHSNGTKAQPTRATPMHDVFTWPGFAAVIDAFAAVSGLLPSRPPHNGQGICLLVYSSQTYKYI